VQPATHRQQSTPINNNQPQQEFQLLPEQPYQRQLSSTIKGQLDIWLFLSQSVYAEVIRKSARLVSSGLQQENLVQASILARSWLDLLFDGHLQLQADTSSFRWFANIDEIPEGFTAHVYQ